MSSYQPCRVCGNEANLNFSILRSAGNYNSPPRYYCSKRCHTKDVQIWSFIIGAILIFLGFLIIGSGSMMGIVIVFIGFYNILKGIPRDSTSPEGDYRPRREKTRRFTMTPKRNRREDRMLYNPPFLLEENRYVYSEILEDDVLKCCYQSARMNDKYCICGRALQYPS